MKKKLGVFTAILIIALSVAGLMACVEVNLTLTFDVDGEQYAVISTSGQETIEMPQDPIKEGYIFEGWYWDKDEWEEPFTANSLLNTSLTSNMTVYAKWKSEEEPVYTVTFVADGSIVETVTYTADDKEITEPDVPDKPGYRGKWEEYTLTTGDVTVEAVYTAIEYTVTFVADGVTIGTATYTAEDKEITEPAVPDKLGYRGKWEEYTLTTGDITVNAVYTIEYTVTFVADGETVSTATYTAEDKEITEPDVPNKPGYRGEWEEYTLTTGDITVNAVYTAIEYTVTFVADGSIVETVTYTADDKEITEPSVPNKPGYRGKWEEYTLTTGDVTVNAVYTIEYTVTFVADGVTIGTATYTAEDKEITEPSVPNKPGYRGKWEEYTLTTGDVTVEAVYTAIEYTVTFVADGVTIGTATYTAEDKEITEPSVPNKPGYRGKWEEYTLTTGDITVNAVYTAIEYTVTFVADGKTVGTATYTAEDKEITEPSVPNKPGYRGKWEEYTLTTGDITVEAVYTPIVTEGLKYSDAVDGKCTVTGYEGSDMEIYIPKSHEGAEVIAIGGSAFYKCSNLTSITIPDSVTTIGDRAFSECSGLTSITIPDSVTTIGDQAFYGCSNLSSITVGEGNTEYSSQDGILYNKEKTKFIHIPSKLSGAVTIPDSVTAIGGSAFRGCSGLTSITIPDSVTTIGVQAFYECSGLTSITIGSGVTTIGLGAFSGCSGLTSITIGSGVTTIGDWAFEGCKSLKEVHITDIGSWCGIEFSGSYSNPLYYAHNLYLNEELVTELEIPDSVTSIGKEAFSGCSGLTSITIPDSVTTIGEDAFSYCSNLTRITYQGSQAQWEAISKGNNWNYKTGNYTIACSNGEIGK